ncbi:MAG: metal ABC transporter solute-binding protein, Zn/Mn family, partial [Cytophagaceae bacterium]
MLQTKLFAKIYAFAILSLLISCEAPQERGADEVPPEGPISIVTTTGLLADAVKHVAGDAAVVTSLMGPGVDPHLYKATDRDRRSIMEANVVYYNGLHLEGRMADVLAKVGERKPVIAVAESGIDHTNLISYNRVRDPHIWFDVMLWKDVVNFIARDLRERYPIHALTFENNAAAYTAQLDSLDLRIRTQINAIPEQQRVLITAHDAFAYFGKAYNIEVRGLQGISTISDMSLHDLTHMVDFIVERGIKAVFVESSVPKRTVEAVVQGARARG